MPPALLEQTTLADLLDWYEKNLCQVRLIDPRGFRVRFLPTDLVHLIKLTTKYGDEPKNARLTLEQIKKGEILLRPDRLDTRRALELPWAIPLATGPDLICRNWVVPREGDEAYVKNFGSADHPINRVMICKRIGRIRQVITIFPRDRIGHTVRRAQIWP